MEDYLFYSPMESRAIDSGENQPCVLQMPCTVLEVLSVKLGSSSSQAGCLCPRQALPILPPAAFASSQSEAPAHSMPNGESGCGGAEGSPDQGRPGLTAISGWPTGPECGHPLAVLDGQQLLCLPHF